MGVWWPIDPLWKGVDIPGIVWGWLEPEICYLHAFKCKIHPEKEYACTNDYNHRKKLHLISRKYLQFYIEMMYINAFNEVVSNFTEICYRPEKQQAILRYWDLAITGLITKYRGPACYKIIALLRFNITAIMFQVTTSQS